PLLVAIPGQRRLALPRRLELAGGVGAERAELGLQRGDPLLGQGEPRRGHAELLRQLLLATEMNPDFVLETVDESHLRGRVVLAPVLLEELRPGHGRRLSRPGTLGG